MMNKTLKSLAFATGCVLALGAIPAAQAQNGTPQVVTNGPQASPGDHAGLSAQQDVKASARYDRLLKTSGAFREARMRKECGPITDPQLNAQCTASFNKYEPVMVGSSTPPTRYRPGGGN